jgi:hypothetical protein
MATLTQTANSAVGQQWRDIFLYRIVAFHQAGVDRWWAILFCFGCPERVVNILRSDFKFIFNIIWK